MEIRLGTIEIIEGEQAITFLSNFEEEAFLELKSEIFNLEKYDSGQQLHLIFIMNFIDLTQYFQDEVKKLLADKIYMLANEREQFQAIYRNANRLFLNILSSGRTYIDHTETYLKRKYGSNSDEVKSFKNELSIIYDTMFEYRFIYKLRNYAQHCGMPISSITYTHQNIRECIKHTKKINLNPIFNRNQLLSNYKEWGTIVRNDIINQESEFFVMPIIFEYYNCIERLGNCLNEIEKKSLKKSIEEISKTVVLFEKYTDETQLCVFYDFKYSNPNSYENSTFTVLDIPMKLIQSIVDNFNF